MKGMLWWSCVDILLWDVIMVGSVWTCLRGPPRSELPGLTKFQCSMFGSIWTTSKPIPPLPSAKKGTISLVGHRNNINEPHSIMKLLWLKKPKSSANWHKYLLKESWMTFHKNYLAFCALSLCLALAAATSGPKLSHKVGNRDQIKTAASNLSAPAEPEPPEYIFRSVAQYFIFPRTFPCLWTWTSQFCERCGPRS